MKTRKTGMMGASLIALFSSCIMTQAAEVTAFREDFETDGLSSRYTVENPSDDGANDFFARRKNLSNGTRTTGGTLSGDYFWAARDIDGSGTGAVNGMDADEARITFASFSTKGLGNFTLLMEAAQGQDELEFDNTFLIQIKKDNGEWETIGGFRGTGTNSPGRYFVGDENTIASTKDARLTNNFKTFSWDINTVCDTIQIRIKENLNGGDEEYAFDNLRVVADNSLGMARMSIPATSFNEGTTTTLTVTLDSPAPAGGVTFSLVSADETEIKVPDSLTVPAGQKSVSVPVEIVADNGYDGDQKVAVTLYAKGYAMNEAIIKVVNVDAKPAIVLNEFVTSVPGSLETDLRGDTNGDGIRNGSQDEFLEFVNNDTKSVDISGWTLSDDKGIRHVFPEGTVLKPGAAIVIFAGGNPTGLFGGAIVQTATAGNFGYGDTGDVIVLSSGGADVISYDYTSTFPSVYQGVTRNPDVTGAYALHTAVSPTGALFSPGTKIDGTPFGTFSNTMHLSVDKTSVAENGSPVLATVTLDNPAPAGGLAVTISTDGMVEGTKGLAPDEVNIKNLKFTIPAGSKSATFQIEPYNDGILDGDRTVTVVVRADDTIPSLVNIKVTDVEKDIYDVVINETMSSIDGTGLDLNGNGTSEEDINDQFIELVNNSGRTVDLSGWRLYSFAKSDTNGEVCVHVFPEGTLLGDQGSLVIFGGGEEDTINANASTLIHGAQAQVSNSGGVGVNLTRKDDGVIRLENPYGYVIDKVVYDVTLADQGQSVTRVPDITGEYGTLHIPATASSSHIVQCSPGARIDGTAFPGNGLVTLSEYEQIFTDFYKASNDYYFSKVFGWTYVGAWPFLYSFDSNSWLYVVTDSSQNCEVFYYSYQKSAWFYTTKEIYPNGWNLNTGSWGSVN
jgi:hypothetical protein